jgi:transcriptional regulator with XRE-family HTH domain
VEFAAVAEHLPSGTVLFPAYRSLPGDASYITIKSYDDIPPGEYQITTPLHSSFAAEWPIPVDIPLALRGFRCALGLSQAKFAAALGQNRLNIERWETGKSRPFRGHILSLLAMLRPLVNAPLVAGQLLNFAAAVVCPHLTRPAATYNGHEIAAPLAEKNLNHKDLAPALIEALVSSEVLVPVDDPNYDLDRRYIPLVGVGILDRKTEQWETELRAIGQRLDPPDRKLWLAVGKRLERTSTSLQRPTQRGGGLDHERHDCRA